MRGGAASCPTSGHKWRVASFVANISIWILSLSAEDIERGSLRKVYAILDCENYDAQDVNSVAILRLVVVSTERQEYSSGIGFVSFFHYIPYSGKQNLLPGWPRG